MNAFEQEVLKTSLSQGMHVRRKALVIVAWFVALGALSIFIIAEFTRDMTPLTRMGLGTAVVINFAIAIVLPAVPARWFYTMVFWWAVLMCLTTVLQVANFHFGMARPLMLGGFPPLMAVVLPLLIVGLFTFLAYSTATTISLVYTGALAAIVILNQLVSADEIASYYGVSMTAVAVFLIMPATILMMRLFYRLHASAVAAVQESFHRARDQANAAVHDRIHDSLTGVMNSAGVFENLGSRLKEAQQTAVVRIKLNDAERFRLSLGDRVFDNILRHIAVDLREGLGPHTELGRLEGCEFILWTGDVLESGELGRVAEELRKRLRDGMSIRDPNTVVVAGHGVFQKNAAVEFVMEEIGFRLYMDSVGDPETTNPEAP